MHHRLLADGTVLFHDAFGLTRVAPAGRAKTDAKSFWQPSLRLSSGGEPACVIDGGTSGWQRRLLSVDKLAKVQALQSGDALLPDGARYVVQGVDGVFDLTHAAVAPYSLRGAPRRERVLVNGGIFHPTRMMLGPSVGDDGRVAMLWSGTDDCELTLVETTPSAARSLWRVELRAGSDTVLAPTVTRDGVAVVGWRPDARRASVVALDHDGALRATRDVDAPQMPAVDEGRVVHQPSDTVVRSTSLATGEYVDFDVAAISERAPRKRGAAPPLDARGAGVVLAGRGRTLFVPWHGETVLDLDAGVEIDRKLPAAQRAHREAFSRWVRDHAQRLSSEGMFAPTRFRADGSAGVTFWCPASRGAAASAMDALKDLAEHLRATTGLRLGGWGTQG